MRTLYFDISNGKCILSHSALPAYRATITGSKIHSIEVCFNVSNIAQRGYDWLLEEVEQANSEWTTTHLHLMKSLKTLALKQSLRHPFKHSNFEPNSHRFPFVLVWMRDKEYTMVHFKEYGIG